MKLGEANKELVDLRSRHQAVIEKYEAAKASVRRLEDREAQSSSRLKRAKAKREELELKVGMLEVKIAGLEKHPFSSEEAIEL